MALPLIHEQSVEPVPLVQFLTNESLLSTVYIVQQSVSCLRLFKHCVV